MPSKKAQAVLVDEPGNGHVTALEFNVVQAKDAKQWITMGRRFGRFGRFATFKERLVEELQKLRKTQALTFEGPKDRSKKEVSAIYSATLGTIKRYDLGYRISYSISKNLFILTRKEENGK